MGEDGRATCPPTYWKNRLSRWTRVAPREKEPGTEKFDTVSNSSGDKSERIRSSELGTTISRRKLLAVSTNSRHATPRRSSFTLLSILHRTNRTPTIARNTIFCGPIIGFRGWTLISQDHVNRFVDPLYLLVLVADLSSSPRIEGRRVPCMRLRFGYSVQRPQITLLSASHLLIPEPKSTWDLSDSGPKCSRMISRFHIVAVDGRKWSVLFLHRPPFREISDRTALVVFAWAMMMTLMILGKKIVLRA